MSFWFLLWMGMLLWKRNLFLVTNYHTSIMHCVRLKSTGQCMQSYKNIRAKLHKQSIKTDLIRWKEKIKTTKSDDKISMDAEIRYFLKKELAYFATTRYHPCNRYIILIGKYGGEPDGVDKLVFHESIERHNLCESENFSLETVRQQRNSVLRGVVPNSCSTKASISAQPGWLY